MPLEAYKSEDTHGLHSYVQLCSYTYTVVYIQLITQNT